MSTFSSYLQTWRLKLSHTKTVTAAFHLNNREPKRELKVYNNGRLLPFCSTPTYLGVKLDRSLTFRHHLVALRKKLSSRVTLLRRLVGSGWGAGGKTLRIATLSLAVLDPNNRKLQRLISQTPVSRHTVERRISRISANVKDKLQRDLANATAFSLALDESTDVTDNPRLAVYVRYVSSDVVVKKELLDLIALKETTRGVDIKKALDKILIKAKIPLNKFVSGSKRSARYGGKKCRINCTYKKRS